MADKSVIIIGAGMAGLSTGCYARMNGYRTHIFEMHSQPGGLCTSWQRQGYTIDGCIHWLMGSAPGSDLHQIWRELGLVQGRQFINHEEFSRYEGPGSQAVIMYTDPDRLERHLKEVAPEDEPAITEMVGLIRRLKGFPMPVLKAPELTTLFDKALGILRMLP
ncbi:MAG: phytoene desaturase family protein [Anaerolineae bacterium]